MNRLLVLLALLSACKPPPPCDPSAASGLQLLVSAHTALNPDERGASWPVHLRVYALAPGPAPERLDLAALLADPASALGAAHRSVHEFTVYPGQRERFTLPDLDEGAPLLAAALFRRPVGQAWYVAAAPPGRRACTDPCLYLSLARNEIEGGRFPPAGFPTTGFSAACAPLVTPAPGARR